MLSANRELLAKGIRWAARLIGLGTMAFFFLAWSLSHVFAPFFSSDILFLVSFGFGLAGCWVSWGREWLAGILLIQASLVMGSRLGLSGQWGISGEDWSRLGLPLLVAGVLFLLSWWQRLGGQNEQQI